MLCVRIVEPMGFANMRFKVTVRTFWEKNWLTEELWEEGAEIRYLNNKKLTEEITQRWMLPKRRGGWEVVSCLRAEILPQRRISSETHSVVYLSNRCQWLDFFFHIYLIILASTCTHMHITTHTSHHITFALPYKMFQELFAVWKTFGVSSSPCFSLLLATHWMFHLSFCEVFPLFLTFGFSFCAVFAIFWNMDVGFCILELQPVVWRDICSISPPK